MGRVRAIAWKGSLPHFVHTQVREIAVKGSLWIQVYVSQYFLFVKGLSTIFKLVRGLNFGPIIVGSLGGGLVR